MSWTSRDLEKELRRIFRTPDISVREDRAWALRHRAHPAALHVFDRYNGGAPYHVISVRPEHVGPEFFSKIWSMYAGQVHQGRKSWADQMMHRARDNQDAQEAAQDRALDERLWSHKDRILHMLGGYRHFALNRHAVRQAVRRA